MLQKAIILVFLVVLSINTSHGECYIFASDAVEVQEGDNFYLNYKDATYSDPHVSSIFRKLLNAMETSRSKSYMVRVYKNNVMNAFCGPDAQVYIYSPIADLPDDCIAGVMAHELGHNEKKHWQNAYERVMLQQIGIAGLALKGGVTGLGLQLADTATKALFFRGYGFEKEWEADNYGFDLLIRTEYNPMGLALFLHEVDKPEYQSPNTTAEFINPHPQTAKRIVNQTNRLAEWTSGKVVVEPLTGAFTINKVPILTPVRRQDGFTTAGELASRVVKKNLILLAKDGTIYDKKGAILYLEGWSTKPFDDVVASLTVAGFTVETE
ncbi:M48 family metallopeptidase [Anaeromusa acidaminophila]|uniref:M48 family metallopeptidase n=1 Tax=Anaeromusa acidaminophila TaxID=81464 RepID=UPI00037D04B8|nr:M48 family metallopeptidase [Anaeromusa acidaminophila]